MRGAWKSIGLVAIVAAAGCASNSGGEAGGETAGADKGAAAKETPAPAADPWAGTGFSVWDVDGRWWVFREGSKELETFHKGGEPAKQVTRIGAGPGGVTLKAVDAETLDAFAAWKPGFCVLVSKDGRIWVFKAGAKELAEFAKGGELAKHVTRIAAGPNGTTLKGPDAETLDAWAASK